MTYEELVAALATKKPCTPWRCTKCGCAVFIPDDADIDESVCPQQDRGCAGELAKASDDVAKTLREVLTANGLPEIPWLTLVFKYPTNAKAARENAGTGGAS